jgi:hypothetical protein
LFPPLVPFYSKPGIQLAFLLVCIVSIYLSFQKVSIEPIKKVRYAQNNEQISKDKSTEELDLKKEESRSELGSNLNAVPESPSSPMENIVSLEEEVIVEMEAPHFDVASRPHLEVSDARSLVADDVEEDSGFFDEADFDGFVSEEGRFIIEPVGSHLELIEDLFVTF